MPPADAAVTELLDFPPWLERVLRGGLLASFAIVLVLPFAGGIMSLCVSLPFDSGCNTVLMRTLLHLMALFGTVLLVLAPRAPSPNDRPLWSAIGMLLFIWLMAAVTSVCVYDSWTEWCEMVACCGFLLVCRELCRSARGFSLALHMLLGGGALSAMLALYLYLPNHTADTAVTGTFYQADIAAGYLLTLFPIALSMLVGARSFAHRLLYGLLTLLLGMLLMLTYSRGGMLATVVAVAALLPLWWHLFGRLGISGVRRAMSAVGVPLLAGLAVVLLSGVLSSSGHMQVLPHKVISRDAELVSGGDSSVEARLAFWKGCGKMFEQRPLLGWGPGTFGRIFPRFQSDPRWYSKFAHSQYAAFLAEGGALTIFAVINCWGVLAFLIWRSWRATVEAWPGQRNRNEFAPIELNPFAVTGIMGSLLAIVMHIGLDVDWEFPALMIMFFILAGMALEPKTALAHETGPVAGSTPWHWIITLPLMGLIALQPAPFVASMRDRASQDARRTNDFKVALDDEFEAARWMPYSSQYRRNLSDLLVSIALRSKPPDNQMLIEAVRQAQEGTRLDGHRAVCWDALARAARLAGQADPAMQAEAQAITCDPINYPSFYDNLAQLMLEKKLPDDAWKTLLIAFDMYPEQIFEHMWYFRQDSINQQLYNVCLTLAKIAVDRNLVDDAIRFYQRALVCDANSILPRFQLAMLYMGKKSDPGAAFMQWREIQRLKPKEAYSQWLLGLCYRGFGLLDRANELMQDAYKTHPELREKAEKNGQNTLTIPSEFFMPASSAGAPGPHLQPEGM